MSKSPNPQNGDVTGFKPIALSLIGGIVSFCFISFFISKIDVITMSTPNPFQNNNENNQEQTQNNNSSPLPNLFRQKEQKRIVVMETANREVTKFGNSVAIPNSYNLCKEHFSAISPREFDAILANGGRVVGSPSDIRENSFDVSLQNSSGWTLGCQMRDYIIEQ